MTAIASTCPSLLSLPELQDRFLRILPRIQRHAKFRSRHVRDHQRRADFIAEVVGISWKWFLRLAQKGKDALLFPSVLADYAARAVRCGRRLCGMRQSKDALNPRAQQRYEFTVSRLPEIGTLSENPLTEALADNMVSPVPDQVQFRIDWPDWVCQRSDRDRLLLTDMALGHRTQILARQYQLSESRVSQLRREFRNDWRRFTSDHVDCPA